PLEGFLAWIVRILGMLVWHGASMRLEASRFQRSCRSWGVLSLKLPLRSYPHNPPSVQSELFYTDAEKKAAQSHKRRAPPPAPPAPRCPCVASVPRPRLIPIMAGVFFLHAERPRDIVNRVTRLGFR